MIEPSAEDAASLSESSRIVNERLAALLKALPTLDVASTHKAMKAVDIEYKRFMTILNTVVRASYQQNAS